MTTTTFDLTSAHGYSADAFRIAEALRRLPTAQRAHVARLLEATTRPISYSGQEFDQTQGLAAALTSPPRATQTARPVAEPLASDESPAA